MTSEAEAQQQIRLAGARVGVPLLRNNSGALSDDKGRLIRYGLGNDSARINKTFKSSDLIGIWPVTITPDMVGKTIGMFTAIEVKPPGFRIRPSDKRAQAQQNFGDWVVRHGGFFRFATSPADIWGDT